MTPEQYHEIREGLLKKGKAIQKELKSLRKIFKHFVVRERTTRRTDRSGSLHEQILEYMTDGDDRITLLQEQLIANERLLKKLRKKYIKSIPKDYIVS